MSATLHVLCAGAAEGLARALQARFESEEGAGLQIRFGAVGALREALEGGAACDVLVVTAAMARQLEGSATRAGSVRDLGSVQTGVAVRQGDAVPAIASAAELAQSLLAAPAIYFPDPERSTAGIHFAGVLHRLDIDAPLAPRLRTYPNGAAAMQALSASAEPGAIGCTQVTEIVRTPGLRLLGALPAELGLATVYAAAVATHAAEPDLAARLIEWLAGPRSESLRAECGFEPAAAP